VKDETIYLIPLITNGTIADVLSKVFSFNLKTKVFTRHDCSICPDDLTFINRAPLRYRSIVFEEKIVKGISLATIDNNCSDTTIHCLLHLTPSFLYYCALDLNKMIWNLKWKISLPASRLPDQNGYAIGAEPIDQMTKICKRFIIDDSDHAYLFIDAKQYDDCRYIFHNFSYQEFNLLLCIDLKISNSSENPVKDPPARPFVAE
jgi:hypothetical protein